MPHECTTCGNTFPDGSKEMLSGCPECGGNKFQFMPASGMGSQSSRDTERPADPSVEDSSGDDIIVAEETEPDPGREDSAQASARSAVVSEEELEGSADARPRTVEEATADADGSAEPVADPEPADRPDLSELREELNDQFESIKILRPGEYELNLMELYDREERIVALEEDGRYVIDVPSSWHETDEE